MSLESRVEYLLRKIIPILCVATGLIGGLWLHRNIAIWMTKGWIKLIIFKNCSLNPASKFVLFILLVPEGGDPIFQVYFFSPDCSDKLMINVNGVS